MGQAKQTHPGGGFTLLYRSGTPYWGRLYIQSASWLKTFGSLAIFITIIGSNLLGNALRDVLDLPLRGR